MSQTQAALATDGPDCSEPRFLHDGTRNPAAHIAAGPEYRASRNVAANHKNCPLCRARIDVGQRIQFVDSKATHSRCIEFHAIHRS